MGTKLVTIIEADADARTAYVQINDAAEIGGENAPPGGNARHTFADDPKDGQSAWKGTVEDSLRACYPGAEIHTMTSMNVRVKDVLVTKGLRVELEDGSLVTPAEKVRLDAIAAEQKAAADALAAKAAESDAVEPAVATPAVEG